MRLPENMHRLAKRAALEPNAPAYSQAFLDRLRGDLLACTGESLRDAARELIFLGVVLEDSGRVDAALQLFDLVESPAVIAALDRANATRIADRNDAVATSAKRFARFEGTAVRIGAAEATSPVKLEELGARRFAGLRLR